MKTLKRKTTSWLTLGLTLGVSAAMPLLAEDSLLADIDQNVLKQQQIDVMGTVKKPDPLEAMRKKLAAEHNKMVEQKISKMRIDSERKLGDKLKKAFSGGLVKPVEDSVSVSQSAILKKKLVVKENNKKMRLIPLVGYSALSGETSRGESIDFESKVSLGIEFAADIRDHISVGVGLSYDSLDITDFSSSYYNNQFYNTYGTNTQWYSSYYGTGRELNSKQLSLALNAKFFATGQNARFRPYLGIGIGMSHLTLKYADNARTLDPYSIYYGEEQFTANVANASLKLGTLINFSHSIGMAIELGYTKGIGASNQSSAQAAQNIDQARLNEIGSGMSEANVIDVKAGLTVGF